MAATRQAAKREWTEVTKHPRSIDDILAEPDDLGLFPDEAPIIKPMSEGDREKQAFEEICQFVDKNGFIPGEGPEGHVAGMIETKLRARLVAFRRDLAKSAKLAPNDRHGLLVTPVVAPAAAPLSLDDILDDDLLQGPAEGIFDCKLTGDTRQQPDEYAARVKCNDFEAFKSLFDQCAKDLEAGRRKSVPFAVESEIGRGSRFTVSWPRAAS